MLASLIEPTESDPSERFAAQFAAHRIEFENQRSRRAAIELAQNQANLTLLLDPFRSLQSCEVAHGASPDEGSSSEALAKFKSLRRRTPDVDGEILESGKIVGVKLNTKASTLPRFRKAFNLPTSTFIPSYTSWNFISANQRQQKVRNQKRLFYTDDDTGETLPASDDEDMGTIRFKWNGKDVEWREYCLASMQRQFGCLPFFPEMLAMHLDVDLLAVEERLRRDQIQKEPPETTLQLCRRCLQYNCSLHPESSVLPALQTPPQSEMPKKECGEDCWLLLAQNKSTAMQESHEAQSAGQAGSQGLAQSLSTNRSVETVQEWDAADIQLLEKVRQ